MQPSILKWTIQFNFVVTVFLSLPVSMVISENPSRDGRLWKETLDGDSIRDHGVPVTMVSGDGKAFTGRIITSGIVQDRNLANVSTREVAWFIGIPYAKPPVGDLRFQSPRPLEEDENTNTEFMEFKPSCQQQLSYSFTADMSEDCLYLNVYAPVMKKSKELYPVMVFIHGGSYRVGGGRLYSGAVLAQRGIIVITFNYRLGVLGFLCGTGEIKGNFGLEDQVEVLHWVQKNIRAFGGDSKKVTIFGNSAGASSVGLLNISLRTKGLFRTAVIQSGSPNAYWAAYRNTDTNILKDYLNLMDCRGNRTLKCLRKARIEDLIAKEYQLRASDSPTRTPFKPCSNGDGIMPPAEDGGERHSNRSSNTCLMKSEQWVIQAGHSTADTVIIGYLKEEWSRMVGWFFEEMPFYKSDLEGGFTASEFKKIVNHVLTERFRYEDTLVPLVLEEYVRKGDNLTNMQYLIKYVELMTDKNFVLPIVRHIESLLTLAAQIRESDKRESVASSDKDGNGKSGGSYPRVFAYEMRLTSQAYMGSYHTKELGYVFGAPHLGVDVQDGFYEDYDDNAKDLSTNVMSLWSNIAKYNSPDEFSDWREMKGSSSTGDYVRITETGEIEHRAGNYRSNKRMMFWSILDKLQSRLRRTQKGVSYAVVDYSDIWFLVGVVTITLFVAVLLALAMVSLNSWCANRRADQNEEHNVPLNNTRFTNLRDTRTMDLMNDSNIL